MSLSAFELIDNKNYCIIKISTCLKSLISIKAHKFCDHTGINPFDSCRTDKELKSSCVFDRHCKSKHCHLIKCVAKKPVKDLCAKRALGMHTESILHKQKTYRFDDRSCSGYCLKDVYCISNKCCLFKCKKPESGF